MQGRATAQLSEGSPYAKLVQASHECPYICLVTATHSLTYIEFVQTDLQVHVTNAAVSLNESACVDSWCNIYCVLPKPLELLTYTGQNCDSG